MRCPLILPLRFVAENALKYSEDLINLPVGWRPPGYEDLWAGAETKLFVFNEVWRVVYGKSLPGLPVHGPSFRSTQIIKDTSIVITVNQKSLAGSSVFMVNTGAEQPRRLLSVIVPCFNEQEVIQEHID